MPRAASSQSHDGLLQTLQARFEANKARHRGLEWSKVEERLKASPKKLRSLQLMEETGGEPDVVGSDKKTGEVLFYDCSPETPKGRVSVCYDLEGLESRKEHKPKDNAMDMAEAMGVELLNEEEYHALQKLGEFDRKTSRCHPQARRRSLRRTTLQPHLHRPQRCAVLLRRARLSSLVEGLNVGWMCLAGTVRFICQGNFAKLSGRWRHAEDQQRSIASQKAG